MRLSDLLEAEVVDRNGGRIGHVHDVRLVQDGPPLGTWDSALRLEALVVGRGSVGTRLGITRPQMKGPWVLKLLFALETPVGVVSLEYHGGNRVTVGTT